VEAGRSGLWKVPSAETEKLQPPAPPSSPKTISVSIDADWMAERTVDAWLRLSNTFRLMNVVTLGPVSA